MNTNTERKPSTPRRIHDLADGLTEVSGEGVDPSAADADALAEYIAALHEWIAEVAVPAVDSIIEVHRSTGIDLKHWGPVLNMVQSVHPEFSIVGEDEW